MSGPWVKGSGDGCWKVFGPMGERLSICVSEYCGL